MTCEEWKDEFNACVLQTEFMNGLAKRYSRHDMARLWDALGSMNRKFGRVFTANAIKKDKSAAELALFRYSKKQKDAEIDCITVKSRKKVTTC